MAKERWGPGGPLRLFLAMDLALTQITALLPLPVPRAVARGCSLFQSFYLFFTLDRHDLGEEY